MGTKEKYAEEEKDRREVKEIRDITKLKNRAIERGRITR